MKIAILISGRINDSIEQYENIIKQYQGNEYDFFVSHSKTDDKEMVNRFIQLYNPKSIVESSEILIDISKYPQNSQTHIYNTQYMFLNRNNVCNLLDDYISSNNIHYDIVVSTRCDIWCISNLNLEINDKLNIPKGNDWGGLNDQFAYGNYEVMKIYMKLDIIEILEGGCIIHPESLLLAHIIKEKLNMIRFDLDYYLRR
jgi:hypothetical protein